MERNGAYEGLLAELRSLLRSSHYDGFFKVYDARGVGFGGMNCRLCADAREQTRQQYRMFQHKYVCGLNECAVIKNCDCKVTRNRNFTQS
jgi:hypothetical protein